MSDVTVRVGGQTINVAVGPGAGPKGDPGGNAESVGPFTLVTAGTTAIPAGTKSVRLSGYADAGDGGGAIYVETPTEPSHAAKFQAADARWFVFSKGERIRPEMFGAIDSESDATAALQTALTIAGTYKLPLELSRPYLNSADLIVPAGVRIVGGNKDAGLKRVNEARTTLTSGFTAGTGAKTFTVSSAAGFRVGMSVFFVNTTTWAFSPNDPFNHINRAITAINGNQITIGAGATIGAHAAGDYIQSACHQFVLNDGCIVEGITLDGNQANQTNTNWIVNQEIAIQGSNTRVVGVHFRDTPSDALLIGGASGVTIETAKVTDCIWDNVGNNGIHLGNVSDVTVSNPTIRGANKRWNAIDLNDITNAHQDGGIIYSNDCWGLKVTGGEIRDAFDGLGSFGSLEVGAGIPTANANDEVTCSGTIFRNCRSPINVSLFSRNISVSNIQCLATTAAANMNEIRVLGSINGSGTHQRPYRITLDGVQIVNGRITANMDVGLQINGGVIDNRAIVALGSITEGLFAANSDALRVNGLSVLGGIYGIRLQNGLGAGYARNIEIQATLTDQLSRGVHCESGNTIDARLACQVRAPASSTLTWAGITVVPGLRVEGCKIDHAIGTAYNLTGWAGDDIFRDNIINGVRPLSSGKFTFNSGTFLVVSNSNIIKHASGLRSRVTISPANAAAATLQGGPQALYIDDNDHVDKTSFLLRTADGTSAAAADRVYYYHVDVLANGR